MQCARRPFSAGRQATSTAAASRRASCSLDVTQHARKILYDDAFSYSRFFRFSNIMESYAPILMKQKALVSA